MSISRKRLATFLALVLVLSASLAYAAHIGGLNSQTLQTQSFTRSSGVTDTFSDPNGTLLSSTTDEFGNFWTVTGGQFVIQNGEVRSDSSKDTVYAVLPYTYPNVRVSGYLTRGGGSTFGMLLNADLDGKPSTAIIYDISGNGKMSIERIDEAGARTVWASATGAGSSNTVKDMTAQYLNGVYTVWVDGAHILTYTTTPAQRAEVERYTGVGIVAIGDNKTLFDNFYVSPL